MTASLPGPWTDAQREAMYGRLLEATRHHASALAVWRALAGSHPPAEFPQLVDGFVALLPGEKGDADAGLAALAAVREVAAKDGGAAALPGLVSDYQALRPLAESDAPALFNFVHLDLPASERGSFLKLQRACGDFPASREAWTALSATPANRDERVDMLADCVRKENRDVALAREELDAILEMRRPHESIASSAASLDRLRTALPRWGGSSILTAYRCMRGRASAQEEALFVRLLQESPGDERTDPLAMATATWTALRQAGADADFAARARLLLDQPPQWWAVMLTRLRAVPAEVPAGVDGPRGERALLRLAAIHDGGAPRAVLSRLAATPGLDRTTALKWLCAMMAEAGAVPAFEAGWQDVHRPGAPGTVAERQLLMANLVESTRESAGGYDAALAILRRLDRVPPADFSATAASAVALVSAMPGRAGDAAKALVYILDARDQGRMRNQTLDDCLARFATLYAESGSVDGALAGLEQRPAGGGGTQRQDGDVVIGGIRVPRAPTSSTRTALRAWKKLCRRFWVE